jgi:nudix-type nucleoside diphosphatase (YffH/AdpP family)
MEITNIETVHSGWAKFLVATVRLADGRTFRREVEDHGAAACVLPYDSGRRTAVLVRQLRLPVYYMTREPHTLEAIAGIVDEADPAETARREAREEAGLELGAIEPVAQGWTMPGVSTERMHLYLAAYRGRPREGRGGIDEDEDITAIEMPLDELARLADSGGLADVKTLVLVQTLRLRRPELFVTRTARRERTPPHP